MSRSRLQGRTVVITGAAQGQGAVEAEALAREGATVVATDVLDEAGGKLAEALRAEGLDVRYRRLDVTEAGDWQALAGWLTAERLTPLHGLVNNAGIPMRARLGSVDPADWNRALAVNTTGPMLGIQALAPQIARVLPDKVLRGRGPSRIGMAGIGRPHSPRVGGEWGRGRQAVIGAGGWSASRTGPAGRCWW